MPTGHSASALHPTRSPRSSIRRIKALLAVATLITVAACGYIDPPDEAAGDERTPGTHSTAYVLRGDPAFDSAGLPAVARGWYEDLLHLMANPAANFDPLATARRDDLYVYGRGLHTYLQSMLMVFRATGDLRLLDHVDEIAEVMRAQLRDGWRDTLDGTDGTRDGYLNWVHRYGDSTTYQGKDTHQLNEIKTHAIIATIAYALHLNRDLPSPGGRDYAAHADFWTDYLVNHFEAKWRERRGVATGFPIMIRPHTHTYYSWTKWHHYMGLLTGDPAYTAEARRMGTVLWEELRVSTTPAGAAYVWPRSVLAEGGDQTYLHPTVYANYVYADIVEFHLEGFLGWAESDHMQRFARTFTELIIDTPDPLRNDFSSDVGGGVPQADLPADTSWKRMTSSHYATYAYALIAAWDPTHRIDELNQVIQVNRSRQDRDTSHLLAGLILHAHQHPVDTLQLALTP